MVLAKKKGLIFLSALMFFIFMGEMVLAQDEVVIWWNKSYYPEEDKKLEEVVAAWEKQAGKKVELNFLTTEDIPKKLIAAIDAKNPPDIAFGHVLDLQYMPKWAYDGQLEDVSDVVTPLKDRWLPMVLQTVLLYNSKTGKKAYYGVPIEQQTVHIHYWVSLLKEIGLDEKDVPRDWHPFWDFWCSAQNKLRKKGRRIYGIGQTMSSTSVDTFFHINMFLNAYGVTFMDKQGKLLVDDPAVRKGIEDALSDFTKPYLDGCTPPGAVNWQDPDNNLNFLNQITLMTPNPTLSIPASQYNANPDNYFKNIRTTRWPNGLDGRPMVCMTAVKPALIFKDSKNKADAKSFLRFLIQPQNLGPYVKGSLGRWFPVMKELVDDPYWKGTKDPHRSVHYRQYTEHKMIPFQQVYNYKYGAVQAENLWGKAVGRIVIDGWSVQKAVDELINRMKKLLE